VLIRKTGLSKEELDEIARRSNRYIKKSTNVDNDTIYALTNRP
jgi:hypothetical protein